MTFIIIAILVVIILLLLAFIGVCLLPIANWRR